MATTTGRIRLRSCGRELETSSDALGELRSSADIAGDADVLRERMLEDGYLYLPGYLDRDLVMAARSSVTDRLAEEGALDPVYPPVEAVARPGLSVKFRPDLANGNAAVFELLYTGRMMSFYREFFGEEVRHFDYTWLRAVAPGTGTAPHGDSVFMNRGTDRLYTSWTPLGDISYALGGLMILEGSHQLEHVREDYGRRDVDSYCLNHEDAELYATGQKWWNGSISEDPVALRRALGGRWLTTEYRAGDLLVFTMYTLHASLDNQSDRVRLSTDSRYQPASEPADERWVGENPVGHGPAGKRGRIC